MYFEIEKQAIDAISDALDKFEVDDTLENFQVEDEKNFRLEFPPNPRSKRHKPNLENNPPENHYKK